MIPLIRESKVTAFIMRNSGESREILAFRIRGSSHPYYRLPGGGIRERESPMEALYREIEEESGIRKPELAYLREMGRLEYYKPLIGKQVIMHDYLLSHDGDLPDSFAHTVRSSDKDNDLVFDYEWIGLDRLPMVDQELSQLLNAYNTPELFMAPEDFGLGKGEIALRPHNASWARIYEFQEMEIRKNGEGYFSIDHIGSTSVPDILAKPIIDILVGVREPADFDRLVSQLEETGYEYRNDGGIPGRHYFTKGTGKETLFHVHAFPEGSPEHAAHLRAKEVLRANRDLRRKYENYKMEHQSMSREQYTAGKSAIMKEILESGRP